MRAPCCEGLPHPPQGSDPDAQFHDDLAKKRLAYRSPRSKTDCYAYKHSHVPGAGIYASWSRWAWHDRQSQRVCSRCRVFLVPFRHALPSRRSLRPWVSESRQWLQGGYVSKSRALQAGRVASPVAWPGVGSRSSAPWRRSVSGPRSLRAFQRWNAGPPRASPVVLRKRWRGHSSEVTTQPRQVQGRSPQVPAGLALGLGPAGS